MSEGGDERLWKKRRVEVRECREKGGDGRGREKAAKSDKGCLFKKCQIG